MLYTGSERKEPVITLQVLLTLWFTSCGFIGRLSHTRGLQLSGQVHKEVSKASI